MSETMQLGILLAGGCGLILSFAIICGMALFTVFADEIKANRTTNRQGG